MEHISYKWVLVSCMIPTGKPSVVFANRANLYNSWWWTIGVNQAPSLNSVFVSYLPGSLTAVQSQ